MDKDIKHGRWAGAPRGDTFQPEAKSASGGELPVSSAASLRAQAERAGTIEGKSIADREPVSLATDARLAQLADLCGGPLLGADDESTLQRQRVRLIIRRSLDELPPSQAPHFMAQALDVMGGRHLAGDAIAVFMMAVVDSAIARPELLNTAVRVLAAKLGGPAVSPQHARDVVASLERLIPVLPPELLTELLGELAAHLGGADMSDDSLQALLAPIHWRPARWIGEGERAMLRGVDAGAVVDVLAQRLGRHAMRATDRDRFLDALFAAPRQGPRDGALRRQFDGAIFFLEALRRRTAVHRKGAPGEAADYLIEMSVPPHHLAATADRLLALPSAYARDDDESDRHPADVLLAFSTRPVTIDGIECETCLDERSREVLVRSLAGFATDLGGVRSVDRPFFLRGDPGVGVAAHAQVLGAVGALIGQAGPNQGRLLREVLAQLAEVAPSLHATRLLDLYRELWRKLGDNFASLAFAREALGPHLARLTALLSPSQMLAVASCVAQQPVAHGDGGAQLDHQRRTHAHPGLLRDVLAAGADKAAPFQLGALVLGLVVHEARADDNDGVLQSLLGELASVRSQATPLQFGAMATCFLIGWGATDMDAAKQHEWKLRFDTACGQPQGSAGVETKAGPAFEPVFEPALRLASRPASVLTEPGFAAQDALDFLELVHVLSDLDDEQPARDTLAEIDALDWPEPPPAAGARALPAKHELAWRLVRMTGLGPLGGAGWHVLHEALLARATTAPTEQTASETKARAGDPAPAPKEPGGEAAADLLSFYEAVERHFETDALHGRPLDALPETERARVPQWEEALGLIYRMKDDLNARIDGPARGLCVALRRRLARTEFLLLRALERLHTGAAFPLDADTASSEGGPADLG